MNQSNKKADKVKSSERSESIILKKAEKQIWKKRVWKNEPKMKKKPCETDRSLGLIDRTFGSETLIRVAEEFYYDKLSSDDKFLAFQLCEEFKNKMKNGDWLLSLLCDYNGSRSKVELGDALWYKSIKSMLIEGTLYMAAFEIPHCAFPDKDFDKNCENLKHLGLTISKSNGCSDGLFEMSKPLTLNKVYLSDEDTPDILDTIELENLSGVVEFGTQKICKSAMTLMIGDALLRVPYNFPFNSNDKSFCAIFVNIKPITS